VAAIPVFGSLDSQEAFVRHLYHDAPRSLARMYDPNEKLFVFRLRRTPDGILREGLSHRYTAITLIGLASVGKEAQSRVLAGDTADTVCQRLARDVNTLANLGDVALIAWAMGASGHDGTPAAMQRMRQLLAAGGDCATVELAWTISALTLFGRGPDAELCRSAATRLLGSYNRQTRLFPHLIATGRNGLRSHVSCFADLVYPIQALSFFFQSTGDPRARLAAIGCAHQICMLQGIAGQWWWHYDYRTGEVIEKYPVYAIHQDAMAPMALRACHEATGSDFFPAIRKGVSWLLHSPELQRCSLIDHDNEIIWRKVARHEPHKLVRRVKAIVTRIHPHLRLPMVDVICPPGAIDYEDRPYHLGWLLFAWRGLEATSAGRGLWEW
jgi:hypothetical protein